MNERYTHIWQFPLSRKSRMSDGGGGHPSPSFPFLGWLIVECHLLHSFTFATCLLAWMAKRWCGCLGTFIQNSFIHEKVNASVVVGDQVSTVIDLVINCKNCAQVTHFKLWFLLYKDLIYHVLRLWYVWRKRFISWGPIVGGGSSTESAILAVDMGLHHFIFMGRISIDDMYLCQIG
jgi:hypothetical protein